MMKIISQSHRFKKIVTGCLEKMEVEYKNNMMTKEMR